MWSLSCNDGPGVWCCLGSISCLNVTAFAPRWHVTSRQFILLMWSKPTWASSSPARVWVGYPWSLIMMFQEQNRRSDISLCVAFTTNCARILLCLCVEAWQTAWLHFLPHKTFAKEWILHCLHPCLPPTAAGFSSASSARCLLISGIDWIHLWEFVPRHHCACLGACVSSWVSTGTN